MIAAAERKRGTFKRNAAQDGGGSDDDSDTFSAANSAVHRVVRPVVIIVMDGGDPPPFNLGPCITPPPAGLLNTDAQAHLQGVMRQRAELVTAFQRPHVLSTPLEKRAHADGVMDEDAGDLMVIGISR
jgi:hypothetical protein